MVLALLQNFFFCVSFLILWGSGFCFAGEKIVSLNACTDEWLLQLALPSQIAGVTRFNHSELSNQILEANPQIPYLRSEIESILRVDPQIVLAGPFSSAELVAQLNRLNVSVLNIPVPRNWDELETVMTQVADLTNGDKNLKRIQGKIKRLKAFQVQSPWKNKKAVFWSAAGHVSGKNTFENTILETLGMENAAQFEGFSFFSLERLIALNPDVVIVTQDFALKNSWSHETLFHPALKKALPDLEYLYFPGEAVSCASEYTVEILTDVLRGESR